MNQPPYKILVFASGYGKGHAATNQLWTELCEHLAIAHEVTVVTAGYVQESELEIIEGVTVIPVGGGILPRIGSRHLRELVLWCCMASKSLTLAGCFDVVVCVDTPRFASFLALPRKLRDSAKLMMWAMDLPLEQVVGRSTAGGISKLPAIGLNWLYYRSLALCDRVVVLGSCMRNLMKDRGVDATRLEVIGPWQDEPAGAAMIAADARRNQNTPDLFTVIYLGYAGAWHDFDPILEAIPELISNYPIQFIFAGLGPGIDQVAAAKAKHGWDNVILHGWMPREQLGVLPLCGDVHLVCLKENMLGTCVPSKTYGALAYGRAVIFIGPEECQAGIDIEDADAGKVVRSKDELVAAIAGFFQDSQRLETSNRNAREAFLKKHCAPVGFQKWDELLANVVAGEVPTG